MTIRTDWKRAWRRMRCHNGRGALPRDRMGILAARCYYDRMAGDALPTRRLAAIRGRYLLRRMFPDGVRMRPITPFIQQFGRALRGTKPTAVIVDDFDARDITPEDLDKMKSGPTISDLIESAHIPPYQEPDA